MFKIGQKVVCKDTSINDVNFIVEGIKKGNIYSIISISHCHCCETEILELSDVPWIDKWCGKCNLGLGYNRFYNSRRFEPFNYDIISNKEILKEIITEKSDLPVKETPIE